MVTLRFRALLSGLLVLILLTACGPSPRITPAPAPLMPTPIALPSLGSGIPAFDHVVLILLENKAYQAVIGNPAFGYFNQLAKEDVLFTQYYGVSHPSLPNYIALVGGDTYNIRTDCKDCFLNQPSLPDLIEKSGRSWKTYQEDMPSPCYLGDSGGYMQKHNPFVYFDAIRDDPARCKAHVVSLAQLDQDLAGRRLPNFAFIMPNICNSGHNCDPQVTDRWLQAMVARLEGSPALGKKSMIFITFDEGSGSDAKANRGVAAAGGHVAAVMISPLAQGGFVDTTELSHYSLLKTILLAWNLPDLGVTRSPEVHPITAPWKK